MRILQIVHKLFLKTFFDTFRNCIFFVCSQPIGCSQAHSFCRVGYWGTYSASSTATDRILVRTQYSSTSISMHVVITVNNRYNCRTLLWKPESPRLVLEIYLCVSFTSDLYFCHIPLVTRGSQRAAGRAPGGTRNRRRAGRGANEKFFSGEQNRLDVHVANATHHFALGLESPDYFAQISLKFFPITETMNIGPKCTILRVSV